jgi:uncharacterized integral membrane protein (TIGR00697 family)
VKLDARLKLFVFLAGLFITSLIVGDLIGGKLYQVEVAGTPLTISVGMIPFPIVFLLTDLINEFYGKRVARYLTLVGFAMAWFTIAVLAVAEVVPFAPFTAGADWNGINQESFDRVFASSQRILLASTFAYLVAQLIDIAVFHFVKRKLGGRFLWLRATGSTVVSQGIDTVVIQFLAWWGNLPVSTILSIIVTSYLVKVVVAIAVTPLLYAGHALVERGLGLEPARTEES